MNVRLRPLVLSLLPFAMGCHRPTPVLKASVANPSMGSSGASSASDASDAPGSLAAATASTVTVPGSEAKPSSAKIHSEEVSEASFVGVVAGVPVRARLTVSSTRVDGRWTYEQQGGKDFLRLHTEAKATDETYTLHETLGDGTRTGELRLKPTGSGLVGTWRKPDGSGVQSVELTREVRLESHGHTLQVRRILAKRGKAPSETVVAFLPTMSGPLAASMNEALSLKALLGKSESELAELTVHVDFRVLFEDSRFLTVEVSEETMGAYPETHTRVVSLDWATGRPLGLDAFAKGKRGDLLRLLNARISAAWTARKEELKNAPAQGDDCASAFSGDSGSPGSPGGSGAIVDPIPKVSQEKLAQVYVTAEGLRFPFRFEFPHAIQACEPTVDLVLPWSEAAAYIEPKGPLSRR